MPLLRINIARVAGASGLEIEAAGRPAPGPGINNCTFTLASRPGASPALTVLLVRGNLFTAKAMSPSARVG